MKCTRYRELHLSRFDLEAEAIRQAHPIEVGTVEFYSLPAIETDNYRCVPRGMLTFMQACVLSTQVSTLSDGEIGDLEWQVV